MPTLNWIGKEKVINHHQDVPFRVLEEQYSFGKPDGNMIIHGDNLDALKALLPQYEDRVNLVYIDPPYNTGEENWIYNDNVNDPKIKKWLGDVVGKEGEDLTRHDKWLCMMYPRLKLLHRLLADDGSIWINLDDNEFCYLKVMCDEIFGRNNFVNTIIWQHSKQSKGYVGRCSLHHNYTIVYRKSESFSMGLLQRTGEHNRNYSNPDNDPRGAWRSGDVRNSLYRPNLMYTITTPSGNTISHPPNGWRFSKETFEKELADGKIIFSADEKRIIRKIYLADQKGRVPETIWFGEEVGTTREASSNMKALNLTFSTPKPERLIERVLMLGSQDQDIILDSFAGSGTTAHAVLNMNKQDGGNRKFILVEMEEYAETITAERVRRVIDGYGEGKNAVEGTGGGFTYYELGEPLMFADGNLNEAVGEEKIRDYVWYMETKLPVPETKADEPYFLGETADTAYYFYYKKEEVTTLGRHFLKTIHIKAEGYIIYADRCVLSADELKGYGITFKKIPRDIAKL